MGFFFSKNISKFKTKKTSSVDHLFKELGCKACSLFNAQIQAPDMLPSGSNEPIIYVLGEAPGKTEDIEDEQFIGKSGQLLRRNLSKFFPDLYQDKVRNKGIRFNNCIRCRPSNSNRNPTDQELICCRKSVEKDIEKTKPLIIIGCGNIPLKWMLNVTGINLWRGRKVPAKIGNHHAWFFPIYHPAFVLRSGKNNEIEDVFERDLNNIPDLLLDLPVAVTEGYKSNITYVTGRNDNDLRKVRRELEKFCDSPLLAIDIESTCLKPWEKDAKLLTLSISNDKDTFAFPIDHPKGWRNKEQIDAVKELVFNFLLNSSTKIAHNLKCELSWLVDMFGQKIMRETSWADTLSQAYVLDERVGVFSLDVQCLIYFGFNLKSVCSLDSSNLLQYPLETVLEYNGVDSKWTYKLYEEQSKGFTNNHGLNLIRQQHVETSKTLTMTGLVGLEVNQDRVATISEELQEKLKDINDKIVNLSRVKDYEKKYGKLNCGSNPNLKIIFKEFYGLVSPKITKKGNESFDEEVVKTFAEQGNILAGYILEFREIRKLKSTYIDSIPKLLCLDGKIRPEFNDTFTATGRLSSASPNAQNFPRRKNKHVRSIIKASNKHWFVAFDYGQLEARNLNMVSGEDNIVKSDIHSDWSERIIRAYPKAGNVKTLSEASKKDFKKFRSKVKNALVFPWFYGAGEWSVGRSLGLPEKITKKLYNDFWRLFSKVKKWQEETEEFYNKYGYVETMTGRRRHAPLDRNKRFNSPIQGCSSDIVIQAMNRLSLLAYKLRKPQYQARLNVHDDLSFYIPDQTLEEDIEFIAREMCRPLAFMNEVPLEVEVAVGKNWFAINEIGKFSTDDFKY